MTQEKIILPLQKLEHEPSIRNMKTNDATKLVQLAGQLPEFTTQSGSFWSVEQLEKWIDSPSDVCLVAESNGKIVGFTLFAAHLPTGKVTWENLWVDPSIRHYGIATKLIHEGLRQLRSKGYKYVAGQINAQDQVQFAVYAQKFGFVEGHQTLWIDQVL